MVLHGQIKWGVGAKIGILTYLSMSASSKG